MNYFLTAFFLLSMSGTVVAMNGEQIVMPSSRDLHSEFKKAGLEDFAQNTDLIKRIAGKNVNSDGVRLAINTEVVDYLYVLMTHRVNIKQYEHLGQQVTDVVFKHNK